jgi:hypothetical protein
MITTTPLSRRSRQIYLIAGNTALLFVLLDVGAHVGILAYQSAVRWMSDDLRFRFGGGAGFLQDTVTSPAVNVNRFGVRSNGDPSRPIAAIAGATWFFGGSTTFGVGVTDRETIPAQLESLVTSPVINFGVSGHGSSMENRLFGYYLRAGYRPSRAVFLDGVGETCQPDMFSEEMLRLTARVQGGYAWDPGRPVTFLANALLATMRGDTDARPPDTPASLLSCDTDGRRNALSTLIQRTLAERRSVCALYGVECRTFIQPFAGVHDNGALSNTPTTEVLQAMFPHLEPVWRAAGAEFVTDAVAAITETAWLDELHHTAAGSRAVATAISRRLAPQRASRKP